MANGFIRKTTPFIGFIFPKEFPVTKFDWFSFRLESRSYSVEKTNLDAEVDINEEFNAITLFLTYEESGQFKAKETVGMQIYGEDSTGIRRATPIYTMKVCELLDFQNIDKPTTKIPNVELGEVNDVDCLTSFAQYATINVTVEPSGSGVEGTKDYLKLINIPTFEGIEWKGTLTAEKVGVLKSKEFLDFKALYDTKQQEQDNTISTNKKDFDSFKLSQSKVDNQQDLDIQANAEAIEAVETDVAKFKQTQANKDSLQDTSISKNTTDITNNLKEFNTFKEAQEKEQGIQNQNIQNNALDLLKKVNKDDYEAAELAQNALIEANKKANEATNKTLENYKQETTKGFQDERELSEQEHQQAIDLANSKATIDDSKLSNKTTFSSYESATRLTCEKTYTGDRVTFKPIEDYPISTLVSIDLVQQPNGDISGWTNVDVTQDNGGTHKVYNQELGKTVYGGTYEFHKGKLTITKGFKQCNGSEAWDVIPLVDGRKQQFVLRGAVTNSSNDLELQVCNKYDVPSVISPNFNGVWINNNDLFVGGGLAETFNSLDDFKSSLAERNLQIVYGLQNSETEIFEQQVINSQSGVNTIYANTGLITITTHIKPLCDGEGGKIDNITLNGVLQIPDQNKTVNLKVITEGEVDIKVATAIAKIKTLEFQVVDMLPETGESNIIYLVPIVARKDNNGYTEWAWINSKWELLGSTEIDLSNVVKYDDILDTTGQATNKVMSQKAVTDELELRIKTTDLTKMLETYAKLSDIENFVTRDDVINDNVEQDSSAYSSKKLMEILGEAKYSTLIVNVQKQGESQYTADFNDNDIRNYFNAGGNVVLRYEDQEFVFDKYQTGVGAVFTYNEIKEASATRIKIVVKYDKSVDVTRETLNTVENANNALNLGGQPVNNFATQIDIANFIEFPTEVALNANTTLIKGWYKTNGTTGNLPFEEPLEDKNGFLRMMEYDHDTRTGIQLFYSVNKNVYIRNFTNGQPDQWLQIPNIETIKTLNYQNEEQVNALIQSALDKIPFAEGGSF